MLKHSYSLAANRARRRAALTLVEMLVAMTCTILLMFAITQTFQNIGEVSARGRAAIELSTQLRGVQHRLHKDLESLTVPVRPWPDATSSEGYFEINEGTGTYDASQLGTENDLFGDFDDVWAMTIRSKDEPFVGQIRGTLVKQADGRFAVTNYNANPPTYTMITSTTAEVIWFTSFIDKSVPPNNAFDMGEPISLHRRVLLVRPDIEIGTISTTNEPTFWSENDISARLSGSAQSGSYTAIANSLGDLTQRENRFAHVSGNLSRINGFLNPKYVLANTRVGEDVMLSSLLAADVRVFDKQVKVLASHDQTEALIPGDPGYSEAVSDSHAIVGYGAYVDLGYANAPGTEFSEIPSGWTAPVYDTWSFWYEHDGLNQDGDSKGGQPLIDEGVDGIDNDNQNGVDDVGERETSPPYPIPLRGIQVRIRVLEPETRQARQATIVQDFIPE